MVATPDPPVSLAPRVAVWVASLGLTETVVNPMTFSGFYDVALRDFGLLIAGVSLALLAREYVRLPNRDLASEYTLGKKEGSHA